MHSKLCGGLCGGQLEPILKMIFFPGHQYFNSVFIIYYIYYLLYLLYLLFIITGEEGDEVAPRGETHYILLLSLPLRQKMKLP